MSFYSFAKVIVTNVMRPLYPVEVIGREHFPKEGGVLLCANHIHNLDPVMVGIAAQREISFMAKEELFRVPILGRIVRRLNAFPVKRGAGDREALRNGMKVLRDGKVLGLFPEGTRSKTGKLGKGLAGAGFFALRTNAEVVPCAIIGKYKPFAKTRVVFGKPIPMEEYRKNKVSAEEVTKIIMDEIAALLERYA